MMILLLRVALVAMLSTSGGCAASSEKKSPAVRLELTQPQIAAVERGVKEALKDPDSARIAATSGAKDEKGLVHVCGTVNAKNSYGGYTGAQLFYGILQDIPQVASKFALIGIGSNDSIATVIVGTCRQFSLPTP